jgi:signal transduction histidine kinase
VLDRVFFRAPYDFQSLVTGFGEAARRELDPAKLLEAFTGAIGASLHPAAVMVLTDEDGCLSLQHAEGIHSSAASSGFAAEVEGAITSAEPFVPLEATLGGEPVLLVVLAAQGDRQGVVVLGARKGELPYYPPDRALVVHLCQTLASNWQNARLFERVVRRNEALAKANAELQQLDTLKRQFLNAVSHELRTPLTSIVGFGEFLTEELGGPLTPLQAEFVGHIRQSARHLNGLVDDMLDYAQVEAGTFRLECHWGTLDAAAVEALESMRPQAVAKHVTLTADVPQRPVEGHFDPVRIAQVVLNLLGNGIKFTPEGGTVTLRVAVEAGDAVITVSDTGIGVREELHDKLFDKFFQVDPSSTRRAGGTGLGLAITRAIVEAHGGTISLESAPGRGSCFTVRLPGFGVPNPAPGAGSGEAGLANPAPPGFHGEDGASEVDG